MQGMNNGNGTILRALIGVVITIVLSYAGWSTTQVKENTNRLSKLERTAAQQETLLLGIKYQLSENNKQVIRRLERIEDRVSGNKSDARPRY